MDRLLQTAVPNVGCITYHIVLATGRPVEKAITTRKGTTSLHDPLVPRNSKERMQLFRKLKKCYVCLNKGHLGKNCRACTKCIVCGEGHHVSICDKRKNDEERAEKQSGSAEKQSR